MSIEIAFEKNIKNVAVHAEVDRDQREYYLLTSLAALFVLGLMFYGWQQYRWIQSGYDIESAQQKKDSLIEDRSQLLVERSSLANLERIDSIARNNLGMTVAAPGQAVTLNADAPLTIPVPPAPDAATLTASKR